MVVASREVAQRRQFGARSPASLTAGLLPGTVWGPRAAPPGPGRLRLARPSLEEPRPLPPCLCLQLRQAG